MARRRARRSRRCPADARPARHSGSAFSGSRPPSRAEQLVFVEMARAQPGHENLPEPAGMAPPHRHAPAVPAVEIADQADPPRVRRPDRERDALDALMHDRVRAELLIAGEVVALDQQMQVEFAEHRRESGRRRRIPARARPTGRAAGSGTARGGRPCWRRTARPDGCARPRAATSPVGAVDDRDALGVGQKRAHIKPGRGFDACRERRTGRRGARRRSPRPRRWDDKAFARPA